MAVFDVCRFRGGVVGSPDTADHWVEFQLEHKMVERILEPFPPSFTVAAANQSKGLYRSKEQIKERV